MYKGILYIQEMSHATMQCQDSDLYEGNRQHMLWKRAREKHASMLEACT